MRRLISIVLFLLLPIPACAAELQRLEFDASVLSYSTGVVNAGRAQALSLTADMRASLFEGRYGKFGVESRPGFDMRSVILNAGLFYQPADWVQVHADYTSIMPLYLDLPANLSAIDWGFVNNQTARVLGTGTLGVRFILK